MPTKYSVEPRRMSLQGNEVLSATPENAEFYGVYLRGINEHWGVGGKGPDGENLWNHLRDFPTQEAAQQFIYFLESNKPQLELLQHGSPVKILGVGYSPSTDARLDGKPTHYVADGGLKKYERPVVATWEIDRYLKTGETSPELAANALTLHDFSEFSPFEQQNLKEFAKDTLSDPSFRSFRALETQYARDAGAVIPKGVNFRMFIIDDMPESLRDFVFQQKEKKEYRFHISSVMNDGTMEGLLERVTGDNSLHTMVRFTPGPLGGYQANAGFPDGDSFRLSLSQENSSDYLLRLFSKSQDQQGQEVLTEQPISPTHLHHSRESWTPAEDEKGQLIVSPLEQGMLAKIALNEHRVGTTTYASSIIHGQADKIVFDALQSAGLVWHNPQNELVGLTDAGQGIYQNDVQRITPLQKDMLVKIARSEYTSVNGAVPKNADETGTWANVIIETVQDKGVFTSLVNAGLVKHNGLQGKNAELALTDAGFAVYQRIEPPIVTVHPLITKLEAIAHHPAIQRFQTLPPDMPERAKALYGDTLLRNHRDLARLYEETKKEMQKMDRTDSDLLNKVLQTAGNLPDLEAGVSGNLASALQSVTIPTNTLRKP